MIKACIFDMDGTVLNTIDSISYFANSALKKFGLAEIETEVYKKIVGNGANVLVHRMLNTIGADDSLYDELLREYNTTYDNDFLYLAKPYDGIMEMLKALKEKGIMLAILSNKPHNTTVKISEAMFSDVPIDLCFGGREDVALKPDPAGVFEIMKELNVKEEECLYIGDTATDMETGKRANLYTIGVLWGFRDYRELKESGADMIIEHPSEIVDIVKNMN